MSELEYKTLLIDCDLIKPKVHSIMGIKRIPGLTDYLSRKVELESIINKSGMIDLDYITAGIETQNTDKILGSEEMRKFLEDIKEMYDIVIFDTAPIIPVIDTQILARSVDTIVLVVLQEKLRQLMNTSIKMIKEDNLPFLGWSLTTSDIIKGINIVKYYYNYSSNKNNH